MGLEPFIGAFVVLIFSRLIFRTEWKTEKHRGHMDKSTRLEFTCVFPCEHDDNGNVKAAGQGIPAAVHEVQGTYRAMKRPSKAICRKPAWREGSIGFDQL